MNLEKAIFCVRWLPVAGEAFEAELVAYECARRDTETVVKELLERGYSKAEILRGVKAAISKFPDKQSLSLFDELAPENQ